VVRYMRLAYRGVIWLFVACVVVQVFLAGLGVFAGDDKFEFHRNFGYTFGWLALLLPLLALAGRLGARAIWLSFGVTLLFILQSVLVGLRAEMPYLAALHPVNALAIFWLSLTLARGSRQFAAAPPPSTASMQ
jgi:hypothetical protein